MRRRGFAFGKPFGRPNIPPALQNAHELMAQGRYAEAAEAFEQLAAGAEKRQGPRAPFLHIQAGLARIRLKQVEAGMTHFIRGLDLFASSGRLLQHFRAGNRITYELSVQGLENESRQIAELVRAKAPANMDGIAAPDSKTPVPLLPTHCPSCGGPIKSDEVDWIDRWNAECSFCGSPVRAQ